MVVNGVAAVIFLCCLAYAGYALWDNWSILDGSENALKTMVEYKPDEEEGLSYNFSQLMAMNPDVCGMDCYGSYRNRLSNSSGRGSILNIWIRIHLEIRRYPEVSFWTGRIIGSLQIHIWYLWGIICRQEKCSVIWINIVMKHFSGKIQLGKYICRIGCYTWKQLRFLQ